MKKCLLASTVFIATASVAQMPAIDPPAAPLPAAASSFAPAQSGSEAGTLPWIASLTGASRDPAYAQPLSAADPGSTTAILAQANSSSQTGSGSAIGAAGAASSSAPGDDAAAPEPSGANARLTLAEAERMALAHNPNVSVAHLLQLAEGQVTRETRAGELPLVGGDITAVGSHQYSRITGGGTLNSPRVLDKAAAGLSATQLITDFGRTHNLVRNAQSNAKAALENERATSDDIRLAVDQAFYQALTAQELLKVAQQTVSTRQTTGQQIGALTTQKLRSTLDLSLAQVQVSQAQLLAIDARNSEQTAMAALNAILGSEADQQYELADETPENPPPAPDKPDELVQVAFRQRPDLASLNDRWLAAKQFASAEHDLKRPTISALGIVGGTPVRDDLIQSSWYGAAGANISIPVFNGFQYSARAKEADYRAEAASEQVRNLRDIIARDVRTAALNAQMAFQRIAVSKQLLDQANTALELAQARYKVGLSGIVDLTQAQLAQTQAQISYTNARYTYQTALAEVRYEIGQ